ncbi:hypothetical protein [Natrialba asiatica]|uniref:Uncharacterized protein n=1 Tax=Natrialba asiatica (strain ATCC 700177 / DSM 12278 / JCM 9576 / FERM P-10747 / NBRC 102637 / 172P1) TaxID=29540 RepID=M0AQC0_NATA1|nr:hypothetical protein [Natrialba asiatica]ELZ00502.1 hypothetical protein C481_12689 [Natrialba asiatica DSM 12278]
MQGSPDDHQQRRDRGQIILIGAIALAFIILGIVVVFNGVLYTETISSSSTSQGASDVEVTQHELETGVSGIVHRSNLDDDDYRINGYPSLFRNVTASGGAVMTDIDIESDPASEATGATGDVDDLNGGNISGDDDNVQVGHFVLEIAEFDGDGIVIDNSTDSTRIDSGTVGSTPARIDLVAGTVNGTPRSDVPQVFDPDTEYDDVTVTVGSNVDGTYELVAKGDRSLDDNRLRTHSGAWAVTATITYESNTISFEQTDDVPVYGGGT